MFELVCLTEIKEENHNLPNARKKFSLGEVYINPNSIELLRADDNFRDRLVKFKAWPEDLDERMTFTKLYLKTNTRLYILGTPLDVYRKLNGI